MKDIIKGFLAYARSRTPAALIVELLVITFVVLNLTAITLIGFNFDQVKNIVEFLDSRSSRVEIASAVLLNEQIDKELLLLLRDTGADRTQLSKFHNGKVDLTGVHFIYSSRANEKVNFGTSSEINRNQNIPISFINQWVTQMLNHQCVIRDKITPAESHYQFLFEQGIVSAVMCPVYTVSGDLIAYLGAEYVSREKSPAEIKKIADDVRESAVRIGGVLSLEAKQTQRR